MSTKLAPPTNSFITTQNTSQNAEKKGSHHCKPLSIFGSPGRTRTADPVINSHLLYRLSYRGIILIASLHSMIQAGLLLTFSLARPERFELPTT